jgi:hypothetical protein
LIFVMALALTGLGPVPLSACALFSGRMAECATPASAPTCDHAGMKTSGSRLAVPLHGSCCHSMPPASVRQQNSSDFSLPAIPVKLLDAISTFTYPQKECSFDTLADPSPPPLQSVLCIFLI